MLLSLEPPDEVDIEEEGYKSWREEKEKLFYHGHEIGRVAHPYSWLSF